MFILFSDERIDYGKDSLQSEPKKIIPDRTAESIEEELDIAEIAIKEELTSIQEVILPSFTVPSSIVEDTCTVYVQGDEVKIENTEIKGNLSR